MNAGRHLRSLTPFLKRGVRFAVDQAGRYFRSLTLFLGLGALFVVGALVSDQFLDLANQRDVLWQVSGNGILAVGMTLVILTAGIDLSVGSLLSLCSVICAMLLMERGWTHASVVAVPSFALVGGGLAVWLTRAFLRRGGRRAPRRGGALVPVAVGLLALIGAILWGFARVPHGFGVIGVLLLVPPVGLLLGALSGTIIAKGNLQPFIVTLAMMVSAVGVAKYIAGQGGAVHPIYYVEGTGQEGAAPAFKALAANIAVSDFLPLRNVPNLGVCWELAAYTDVNGEVMGIWVPLPLPHPPLWVEGIVPVPGLFFVAAAVAAWLLLNSMNLGRRIFAVGGNEEAARYSGINTDRVKIFVYAASGMLSALAAVLYCAQYTQGKADAGFTRELDAIAAVVIGGTSLMGGRGSIVGTVVGVFIFGYLNNILNLQGVSSEFQAILKGVIIIVAVLLQEGILTRWFAQGYRRITTLLDQRGNAS